MENSVSIRENDVRKGGIVSLVSPRNPTPIKTVYLSNIDQTVAFPVRTVFFYEVPPGGGTPTFDVTERVRRSVSEVLLIPYYFMAGRLNFNLETKRLELVCNNAGVLFVGATSSLRLNELKNLSLPNPSFRHLVLQTEGFESLAETPIFTIQVTRFKCGGFSIGFVTNHSILDGRSAAEMFENLASICKGDGMKTQVLDIDRSCIRPRDPPQIKFQHEEYTKLAEATSLASSFTSPIQPSTSTPPPGLSPGHDFRMFSFSPDMIGSLKEKAATNCSSFEAIVGQIWRARTKAVFDSFDGVSSVLFAVDIRSRMSPPLPQGFGGNAVIPASASAKVADLGEKPFSFCVEMVKEAIERVTDEYVRSAIDWLEVHRGVPSTLNGNFFLSAWWKLPFHELDFGCGNPLYGGPVVGGMGEFVLLLSSANKDNMGGRDGVNVWIALEEDKMERFLCHVFEE